MAVIIPGNLTRQGTYRFNELFDGQQRMLVEGDDFTAAVESVRTYIWRKARKLGIKVSVFIANHEGRPALLVQAFP